MKEFSVILLVLTTVFPLSLADSVLVTLPPLNNRKQNLGQAGGPYSGLAPPPAPPSDDEDAPVAARPPQPLSSVSGDRQPPAAQLPPSGPLAPPDSGYSGDARPPPPPEPPRLPGGNAASLPPSSGPTVGVIELPMLKSATTTQRPQPPPARAEPTQAEDSYSCASNANKVLQVASGIRYRPTCQTSNAALYRGQQCGSGVCFCVDERTGELIKLTDVPTGRSVSCTAAVFLITLGFETNWDDAMARPTSASFRDFAQRIEAELDRVFDAYQGVQTPKVVRLRPGSVIADIQLTSIGHPSSLTKDVQEVKQLLDSQVATRKFAGMDVAPRYYSFRRDGASNQPGESNDSEHQGRSAGNNGQTGSGDSNAQSVDDPNQPKDSEADQQLKQQKQQQQQQQQLSAASLLTSPGVLAAAIAGALGFLVIVALIAMFFVYRARKANAGSYKTNGGVATTSGPVLGGNGNATNGSGGSNKVIYKRAASEEYFA